MNFLEKIVAEKHKEVLNRKAMTSMKTLSEMDLFTRQSLSLSAAIKNGSGIIGEFKRMSPSAGSFNVDGNIVNTVNYYETNGVSAYSVLTDKDLFGGDLRDILTVRSLVDSPILRKDFIVDEYQIFEAKAYGADAILLIADALDEFHCENLTTIAKSLGLEVLMEFHSKEELVKLNENVDVIGINNRNLKTMTTEVKTSLDLIKYLPFDRLKISESGIHNPKQIQQLIEAGYDGFLMGEYLLKSKESNGIKSIVGQVMNSKKQLL